MRRVRATILGLVAVGVLVVVIATAPKFAVPEPAAFVDCRINGARVEVTLGATHRTGFVGVVTPAQEVLRLVDAPKAVDLLGQRYSTQPLLLSIPNEVGVTEDGRQQRIFTTSGEYEIVFRDVEGTSSDVLPGIGCKVNIQKE